MQKSMFKSEKQTWETPDELFARLDKIFSFNLDACADDSNKKCEKYYTETDNSLTKDWVGNVWCNPPYDRSAEFLNKLKKHGNGIALVFARTETQLFFKEVWNDAHAILFLEGRLTFWHVNGTKAVANGEAPSVLIAYGEGAAESLERCDIKGKFVYLK